MDDSQIDKAWRVLMRAEKQLYRQFNTIRSALPHMARTPPPRKMQEYREIHREHAHFGGILNNLNSPVTQPRAFSHVFKANFDLTSLLPARNILCQPHPLARRMTDPHSRSNLSMLKTQKKPATSGFRSIVYFSPSSAETHSCERCLQETPTVVLSKQSPVRKETEAKSPSADRTVAAQHGFPQRKSFRRLKPVQGFAPSQQLDYMIREQANRRGSSKKNSEALVSRTKRTVGRLKGAADDQRRSRNLPLSGTPAEELDEDKCVVEGEETNPVVHLPQF